MNSISNGITEKEGVARLAIYPQYEKKS